jgi:hypothetical protein
MSDLRIARPKTIRRGVETERLIEKIAREHAQAVAGELLFPRALAG